MVEEKSEICKLGCWCNSLVEIKLCYPTREIAYIVLVESKMHDIDLNIFGQYFLSQATRPNQSAAIEARRNRTLPRISESSVLQESHESPIENSIEKSGENSINKKNVNDSDSETSENSIKRPQEQIKTNGTKLSRKSSFDSSKSVLKSSFDTPKISSSNNINTLNLSVDPTIAQLSSVENQFKQRVVTFSNNNTIYHSNPDVCDKMSDPNSEQTPRINNRAVFKTSFPNLTGLVGITSSPSTEPTKIEPNEIFLNLCQQSNENGTENLFPIPEENERSVNTLAFYPCCMHMFKIGVIYIRPNQADNEKAILSNSTGSLRYKQFLKGLGTFIKLKDIDMSKIYPGGLERDGCAGDFTIYWSDGISQIMFHVATMLPTTESTINKKKHIGNDEAIIVYNESGEEYQFDFLKGEVNCLCIEVEPIKCGKNIVRMKTGNDMTTQNFGHTDPQVISDNYVSLMVRKMAFHSNLAIKFLRKQKEGDNYGGSWWSRLKRIMSIRNSCKPKTPANSFTDF